MHLFHGSHLKGAIRMKHRADRVELCDSLSQGGTTPSAGAIAESVKVTSGSKTRVHVLIRPRPGDFCYTEREKRVMASDVAAARALGAHGVVVGALLADGRIDFQCLDELVALAKDHTPGMGRPALIVNGRAPAAAEAARPMEVTFHRAFDVCAGDPVAVLASLRHHGVDFVLTSGHTSSAWEGRDLLRRLVRYARSDEANLAAPAAGAPNDDGDEMAAAEGGQCGSVIRVIAGVGVSQRNAQALVSYTGVRDIHAGSALQENLLGIVSPKDIAMGSSSSGREHLILRTSASKVRQLRKSLVLEK